MLSIQSLYSWKDWSYKNNLFGFLLQSVSQKEALVPCLLHVIRKVLQVLWNRYGVWWFIRLFNKKIVIWFRANIWNESYCILLKQSNNFRNVSSCWCYQEGNTAKNFSIKGWHTQKPTKKTSHSLLRVICGLFPKIQTEQGSGITYFTWIDLKLNSHFERFWLGEWTNGRFNMRACSTK